MLLAYMAEKFAYPEEYKHLKLGQLFFGYWSSWSVFVFLSPLLMRAIYLIVGRDPGEESPRRWNQAIPLLVLAVIIHRIVASTLIHINYSLWNQEPFVSPFRAGEITSVALGLVYSIFISLLFAAFLFGIQFYRWYWAKEKELANAKLSALVMQLRPHFLFNTLNSISSLVDIDSKRAQRMLAQLGYLLRKMLDQSEPSIGLVPLDEELTFLRNYLDIEQVRFEDRLKVEYDIGYDTERALVPYLIVQPLVENAIKHGVASLTENGIISLKTRFLRQGDDDFLEVEVADNGPGIPDDAPQSGGVGLQNIRQRLQQRYGSKGSLTLQSDQESRGLRAVIRLPYVESRKPLAS